MFTLDRPATAVHPSAMVTVGSVSAVTLGSLLRIVAGVHGVPSARLPALKGRFTNFLKLPFPEVKSTGTGTRTEFWPEHVAQVLVAFELVRFRVPQSAAARGVSRHTDVAEGAIGDAARRLVAGLDGPPILVSVRSNALLEDAKRPDLSDVSLARVGAEPDAEASSWNIDAVRLVAAAVAAARSGDEPLDAGFFTRLTDRTPG